MAEVYAHCSLSPQSCLVLDTLFVIDEQRRYLGVVTADRLGQASESMLLADLMQSVPAVRVNEDEEQAAVWEWDLSTVPVVDGTGKLCGAIFPRALRDILHHAHLEDMNRFVGI
ncbi:CBS domain-containing protein [Methylothermus subterraneus]